MKSNKEKLTKEEKKALKQKKKENSNPIVKKAIIFVIVIILVMALVGVLLAVLLKKPAPEPEPVKQTISALDKYGYTLDDKDTKLYKEEFEVLKKNLESSTIDFDAYAESIAKLFIIDFYSLDNKLNKYDVGGIEFVFPDYRDTFKIKAQDTIYNYLEDNTKGNRKGTLPIVDSVTITSNEKSTYTYTPGGDKTKKKEYDSYEIKYTNTYNVSQGYDTAGVIDIIRDGDFLYIVSRK